MNEFISSEIYNPLLTLPDIKVKFENHEERIAKLENLEKIRTQPPPSLAYGSRYQFPPNTPPDALMQGHTNMHYASDSPAYRPTQPAYWPTQPTGNYVDIDLERRIKNLERIQKGPGPLPSFKLRAEDFR